MTKKTKAKTAKTKKLTLSKEKVRDLQNQDLDQASGGRWTTTGTTDHSLTTFG